MFVDDNDSNRGHQRGQGAALRSAVDPGGHSVVRRWIGPERPPPPSGLAGAAVIDLRDHQVEPTRDAVPIWQEFIVRFGIASIFVVNAIVAIVDPDDFRNLLATNPVGSLLPTQLIEPMVFGAAVNDALLGAAVLVYGLRRQIWVWMALWLLMVGGVKFTSLLW